MAHIVPMQTIQGSEGASYRDDFGTAIAARLAAATVSANNNSITLKTPEATAAQMQVINDFPRVG